MVAITAATAATISAAGAIAGGFGLRNRLAGRGRLAVAEAPSVTEVSPETTVRAQEATKTGDFGAV